MVASLLWLSPCTLDPGTVTVQSAEQDPTSFPLFQDRTAAQHRDSGHGKPNILPSRTFHHLVLKRSFIAQLTCFARWGYLAMNSASTFGVEGTRWLQSAKATAQTLLNTFGGAGVGLVLCYCFYGHIIPVGKMVNCTMGSLVSNTAITFLCTAPEVIVSVLHQNEGGIWKSIPDAREIS